MTSISGLAVFPSGFSLLPNEQSVRTLGTEIKQLEEWLHELSDSFDVTAEDIMPFESDVISPDSDFDSTLHHEMRDTFGVNADKTFELDEVIGILSQKDLIDSLYARWIIDTTINYEKNFEPLKHEFNLLKDTIGDLDFDDLSDFAFWLKGKEKRIIDIEEKRQLLENCKLRLKQE